MWLELSVILLWVIVIIFIILGIIAYHQHTLEGPTGPMGRQGQPGQPGIASNTGATGPQGPSGFSQTETHAYFNLQARGIVTYTSGATFVFNNFILPTNGQITYNNNGGITVKSAGRYQILWGYNVDGSSLSTTTTLYVNGTSQGPSYTLRAYYNGSNSWDTHPHLSCIINLDANSLLTLRNSSTLGINLTDGGISPPQPTTQIAYLTIVKLT
jgi:hypothetical protein